MLRAALIALLEPVTHFRELEAEGNHTARFTLQEELKSMPWGIVWNQFCAQHDVPVGSAFLGEIESYETNILSQRA